MLDTHAETTPDRRPAVLVCVCDADDPEWSAALNDMAETAAARSGAPTRSVGPGDPAMLAGLISGELSTTEGLAVLLVGRTRRTDGFRLQMRAENRALAGGAKLTSTGPATARATAPVAEMVRALNEAGLQADASSESEEDAGSYLLYRVLTALPDNVDAPSVALLRVPMSVDAERLRQGVQTVAGVMARHISPLQRPRLI